ncbi:DNAse superfamily protein [Salix suchowensis]|nr:DNAse superfamily protein [Salix suchowensis]
MLKLLNKRLRRLYSRFRWPVRRGYKPKVTIKKFGKSNTRSHNDIKVEPALNGSAAVHPNGQLGEERPIKLATFNAACEEFADTRTSININKLRTKSANDRPKTKKFAKSKLRVSINLPDNEISLLRNRQLSFREDEKEDASSVNISRILRGKAPMRSQSVSFARNTGNGGIDGDSYRITRTVLQVLKELDADILALQDVKAEEEKAMKPLSDLAAALGMNYVFAESWAPEYGNAILSKWPIKRWKVQKIFDDTDFRNVLKATIDVPQAGEVNFHYAIIQSSDAPHILAGGLNSLDETDYSEERWTDIVKNKHYTDAKDFTGECESVVMIAKGQNVQGTCKYGTRVDYVLASPNSPYKFVPGSYSVDIVKARCSSREKVAGNKRPPKQKVVKITNSSPAKGIWKTHP